MKKFLAMAGVVMFVIALVAGDVFASADAYNFANSVEYTRTQSRNATTATMDSVYYNPAGLVKLADGWYLQIADQMGMKKFSHRFRVTNREYADTTFIPMIPNGAIVYKKDRAAIFGSMDVPAGGGEIKVKDNLTGIPLATIGFSEKLHALGTSLFSIDPVTHQPNTTGVNINKLYAKNLWSRMTVGGSFLLTDSLAFTGGIRFAQMFDWRKAWANWTISLVPSIVNGQVLDQYTHTYGFNGFFGTMFMPTDSVKITALYNSETNTKGTTIDYGFKNFLPEKYRRVAAEKDLPAYVALGLAVKPVEIVEVQISFDYVFSGERKLGTEWTPDLTNKTAIYTGYPYAVYDTLAGAMKGYFLNKKQKDQMRLGVGFEFFLGKLKPSIGFSLLTPNSKSTVWNQDMLVKPELFELAVGAGLQYSITDNMAVDFAVAKHWYRDAKYAFGTARLSRDIMNFGLGLTTKI
jgi:long-subunit fatty acid transport protein